MSARKNLEAISRASSDGAAIHALLKYLDTLPPQLLIAAEGRRMSGMSGGVTDLLPIYRAKGDTGSTVELQVETEAQFARLYWEHPYLMWTGLEGK
ncbi:MAG TPA: hypothetical protein VMY37_17230 [Thermoguttaceae bacterium]|nr:hypothetical protein [Thermoguttaceae bacterium]